MTVEFLSYCPTCYRPVKYVNSRPATHDCINDDNDNEESD